MIEFVNKYVFGTAVPVILVLAGIYYLILLNGLTVTMEMIIVKKLDILQKVDGLMIFQEP